jgi:phospholipid/cholesterol/gamma-HCH transport system ATP-binding protein
VTHQLRDAFHVATHEAVQKGGSIEFVQAGAEKSAQTEFLMLRDGLVAFEGSAAELHAAKDEYLRAFLS